jgi:hypothetical protein
MICSLWYFDQVRPSRQPSSTPTNPTTQPSSQPSRHPTSQPSTCPTNPTTQPSKQPSSTPSSNPSSPSSHPTGGPTFNWKTSPKWVLSDSFSPNFYYFCQPLHYRSVENSKCIYACVVYYRFFHISVSSLCYCSGATNISRSDNQQPS